MATAMARNGSKESERIEFELSAFWTAVLDGYSFSHGLSRAGAAKKLLIGVLDERHREAVSIMRVAGDNPETPGNDRD